MVLPSSNPCNLFLNSISRSSNKRSLSASMDSYNSSREKSGLRDLRDLRDDLHFEERPPLLSGGRELKRFSVELYRLEAKLLKSIGSIMVRVGDPCKLNEMTFRPLGPIVGWFSKRKEKFWLYVLVLGRFLIFPVPVLNLRTTFGSGSHRFLLYVKISVPVPIGSCKNWTFGSGSESSVLRF